MSGQAAGEGRRGRRPACSAEGRCGRRRPGAGLLGVREGCAWATGWGQAGEQRGAAAAQRGPTVALGLCTGAKPPAACRAALQPQRPPACLPACHPACHPACFCLPALLSSPGSSTAAPSPAPWPPWRCSTMVGGAGQRGRSGEEGRGVAAAGRRVAAGQPRRAAAPRCHPASRGAACACCHGPWPPAGALAPRHTRPSPLPATSTGPPCALRPAPSSTLQATTAAWRGTPQTPQMWTTT